MNKKLLILSIVGGLLLIVSLILFIINSKKQAPAAMPSTEKISISTEKGAISINNYYKDSANIIDEKDVTVKTNEDYTISAFDYSEGRSFLISIESLTKDPETVRKEAENTLLASLGITQDQACMLTVVVSVSKDIDESLAGQDFGLSFCPNGKPFYTSQQ